MRIPPGYEQTENRTKVCKLNKALYGLKLSRRAWFGKFTLTMKVLGYKQCNGDRTPFFQYFSSGEVTILIVFVDNIIIMGNNDL